MKNPFLTLLEDPASLIIVEFDNAEKEMIVRMLEEKINNAMAEYKNPEQHDYYAGKGAMGFAYNEWLHYLDTRWDGKLNRTFEMFGHLALSLTTHLNHFIYYIQSYSTLYG